ncbi:MAG TPA: glycosyltransferase family 4 protein [Phycisphaerae bacterium]|nr:glycosyltransferase family 4 protein [Phycisphaerae bacterium]HPS52633.1 glycosyltransferase family 4 protein [Phycisphaerae bacterium]
MKIVHFITRLILGGAQENTILTCLGQLRGGHDVTLITGPAIGPEGELLSWAKTMGFRVEVIDDLRREISPRRDWRSARRLEELLRELQPDVFHTHSSKAGIIGRNVAWKLGGMKVVHTIHGLPFNEYNPALSNMLYVYLERRAAKQCHKIICVADAMARQALGESIGEPALYTTVYSGMETLPFMTPAPAAVKFRESLDLPDDAVLVTQVSRLAELKGHEYIIEAARDITDPRVHFCFVGDGKLRPEIELAIDDAGMAERFHLTGLLPREAMPAVMQATDILVHCSLREGLARALPQAMLAGRPVISYDVDGAREVVTDDTGILLEPEEVDGLRKAVIKLADNPQLRKKLGDAGCEFCRHRFDWLYMVDEIMKVYEKI